MRAVVCTRYGPPDVLQVKEIRKPFPKGNEVCIRIIATAVTSSDCIIRSFNVPLRFKALMGIAIGFTKPRNPILGMVLSGEIESVGNNVKTFRKGDQVFGFNRFEFGCYAEFVCWPESAVMTYKPANSSHAQAAALPYGGLLALHYLKKGNIRENQNVLIYGASGAVGTMAVQLAKYYGATVTSVCSTGNLELVKTLGADRTVDYTKEDIAQKGELFDLIFDAVPAAHRTIKLPYKKMLTANGKYISVTKGTPRIITEDLILIKKLVDSGKIESVIDRVYPMDDIVEAHRFVDLGRKRGNVIIAIP
jgi:NADPH:quinone reductase-like Zn-dependent oxidoreductase